MDARDSRSHDAGAGFWRDTVGRPKRRSDPFAKLGVKAWCTTAHLRKRSGSAASRCNRRGVASGIVALVAVLVVIGLAVAEYDRHEAWKKDALFWRKQVMKNLESDAERNRRQMAWYAIEEAIDEGRDKLYLPLRTTSKGSSSEWIAAIDQWDARTIARLEKHLPAELDFYRADIKLVEHLPDTRERLQTIMDIKLNRLMTVYRRSLGLEDGEPVANSPAG